MTTTVDFLLRTFLLERLTGGLCTDEFASAPSSAGSDAEADGFGWSLDGVQTGALLVGSADPDGVITAAWIDSWHQKPHLGVLSGRAVEGGPSSYRTTGAH